LMTETMVSADTDSWDRFNEITLLVCATSGLIRLKCGRNFILLNVVIFKENQNPVHNFFPKSQFF
jgi:hypothetical protein